jgi:hypothetical protein
MMMTDDLVRRLRESAEGWDDCREFENARQDREAADRIEELKRHIELRDFFLTENDLWETFAKGTGGKSNDQ